MDDNNVFESTYKIPEVYPALFACYGEDGSKRHPSTGLKWKETVAISNALRSKWPPHEREAWYAHVAKMGRITRKETNNGNTTNVL